MPRYAARVDRNHAAIVSALRACGASVVSLAREGEGCPDILVGHQRQSVLMEIKSAGGKLNDTQQEWHSRWRGGPLVTVWTVEDALRVIGVQT